MKLIIWRRHFLRFCENFQNEQVSISPPPPIREVPQGYAFCGPDRQFSENVDGWSPRVLSEELFASRGALGVDVVFRRISVNLEIKSKNLLTYLIHRDLT